MHILKSTPPSLHTCQSDAPRKQDALQPKHLSAELEPITTLPAAMPALKGNSSLNSKNSAAYHSLANKTINLS